MKICYIAWAHSIHTQRWVKWFAKRGNQVHLITDHPYPIDGIKSYNLKRDKYAFNYKLHILFTIFKIKRFIAQIKPDVLHLHTLYFPSYLGLFAGFHPLVVTFWNGDLLWKYDWSNLRSFFVNFSFKIADLITVDSEGSYRVVEKRKSIKCRLETVSWGVDLNKFKPTDNKEFFRKKIGIVGWPVVISTRGLGEMYNTDVIMEAIPLVLKEFPEAKFLFMTPFKDNYQKYNDLTLRLGVSHAVKIVGNIPHDSLPNYLNASDVMVSIPSSDSASISVLESMACGVPLIVGDVEGAKDFIVDGVNGYLVTPRDSKILACTIIKTILDKVTSAKFIERNMHLVKEKTDHDEQMGRMEVFYHDLIKKRSV